MLILRSWPAKVQPGRPHVVDNLPRLIMTGYDYAPLATVEDDVLLLEWDIAVTREELIRFAEQALECPDEVLCAPYRLYVSTQSDRPLREPVWVNRHADGRHVDTGDPTCAFFGLGMTYLPRGLVRAFHAQNDGQFTDMSFSAWHHENVRPTVPIAWDARPVHLHYKFDEDPNSTLTRALTKGRKALAQQKVRPVEEQPPDEKHLAWLRDENRPGRRQEIAALLHERDGLRRAGKIERLAAVERELELRGYKEVS